MTKAGQIEINNALITLSMVKQFHMEGKYYDVQLQVNDELFKCQRSLLAAISEYFDTMFGGNFKESNTLSDKPITLHALDATAFKELLRFIYTGDVAVNVSNVYPLLFMSDFLRLRTAHIKEQCIKYLKDLSHKPEPISNALDLLSFASMTKAETELVNILTTHVCEHLHHYSKVVELMEISFENLNTLLEFSKNYILPLPGSQNVVLKIIYNWINHNREERCKYRSELMRSINFSNVSIDYMSLLMNSLEDFADAVTGLPKKNSKLLVGKLETLKVGMLSDLTVGDARSEGFMLFDVKNLSKMKIDDTFYSPSSVISNLSWKISIQRYNADDLGVYLDCFGPNETRPYKCHASYTFTLMSHKRGKKNFVVEYKHSTFHKGENSWGQSNFISWNELIRAENGYIKDDDSITIQTYVRADVPFYN